jgi:hypothetical protein
MSVGFFQMAGSSLHPVANGDPADSAAFAGSTECVALWAYCPTPERPCPPSVERS